MSFFWEERERIHENFEEQMFLLARKLRYGLGPCQKCEDPEPLILTYQLICWTEENAREGLRPYQILDALD